MTFTEPRLQPPPQLSLAESCYRESLFWLREQNFSSRDQIFCKQTTISGRARTRSGSRRPNSPRLPTFRVR